MYSITAFRKMVVMIYLWRSATVVRYSVYRVHEVQYVGCVYFFLFHVLLEICNARNNVMSTSHLENRASAVEGNYRLCNR